MSAETTPQMTAEEKAKKDREEAEAKVRKAAEVIDGEVLKKSLDALTAIAGAASSGRQEQLLLKAGNKSISEAERGELIGLLSGHRAGSLENEVDQRLGGADLKKSIDVSKHLTGLHGETQNIMRLFGKRLDGVAEQSLEATAILAKSQMEGLKGIVQIGQRLTALEQTLATWGRQPSRTASNGPNGPGGQGGQGGQGGNNVVPLNKGFGGASAQRDNTGGGDGQGDGLDFEATTDVLEQMHEASIKKGMNGRAECGESLETAMASWTGEKVLSAPMADEVRRFAKSMRRG